MKQLAIIPLFVVYSLSEKLHPLSEEFITNLNEKQSLWKAGRNFPENTPIYELHKLVGNVSNRKHRLKESSSRIKRSVPDSFDSREKWTECPSIRLVTDQSNCGSCWAMTATSVMTDRICIHSSGKKQVTISAADLLSCCLACGNGCYGGDTRLAWEYWVDFGIVTGGSYGSGKGCKSYFFPPCSHHINGTHPQCNSTAVVPKCKRSCDKNSTLVYEDDLTFGTDAYVVKTDEESIKGEILLNGPVEAVYKVYSDFFSYKSGVYKHIDGDLVNAHAVKIIGWGQEKQTPYWLVANTWNEEWGDKGFFKILRGHNECGIETTITAGLPTL